MRSLTLARRRAGTVHVLFLQAGWPSRPGFGLLRLARPTERGNKLHLCSRMVECCPTLGAVAPTVRALRFRISISIGRRNARPPGAAQLSLRQTGDARPPAPE